MRRLLGVTAWVTLVLVLFDIARTPEGSIPAIGAWPFLLRVAWRGAAIYGGTLLLLQILAAAALLLARRLGLAAAGSISALALYAGTGWAAVVLATALSFLGFRASGLRWPSAAWLLDLEIAGMGSLLAGWGLALLIRRVNTREKRVVFVSIVTLLPPLLVALPVFVSAGFGGSVKTSPGESGAPDILLIVADSLRADALSCYGGAGGTTPALDRLAAEGVRFEEAMAASPGTAASTASILTSRLPAEHGVTGGGGALLAGTTTLAEALRARGYETSALISGPFVSRASGLDRGFALWDDDPDPRFAAAHPRTLAADLLSSFGWTRSLRAPDARRMVDRALGRLGEGRGGPRFLYLDLSDPRDPYGRGKLSAILRGEAGVPPEELARAREVYGARVATLDAEVGRLLKGIEGDLAAGSLLVIFTADHGEEFMDHGSLGHGHSLYQELLHVPLIVARPGHVPGGGAIRSPVSLLDVAPTILDLAGVPPEPSFRGRSLARGIGGAGSDLPAGSPVAADLDVVGYHTTHRWMRAARQGEWKVILSARDVLGLEGWDREAYDLAADPAERVSRSDLPEEARRLEAWLVDRLRVEPPAPVQGGLEDAERQRRIRSLGYAPE